MNQINLIEGNVVAKKGMKVGIVAARFNEIIVNKLLGGAVERCEEYPVPGTELRHCAVLIRKEKDTPPQYPRRWAQIKKQPL